MRDRRLPDGRRAAHATTAALRAAPRSAGGAAAPRAIPSRAHRSADAQSRRPPRRIRSSLLLHTPLRRVSVFHERNSPIMEIT